MANKISESVIVMKKNFMTLHNQGFSIGEIAKKYNLTAPTIYRHLESIAVENGLEREDLLQVVKSPYSNKGLKREKEKVAFDKGELQKGIKESYNAIQGTIEIIDKILEEEKQYEYDI